MDSLQPLGTDILSSSGSCHCTTGAFWKTSGAFAPQSAVSSTQGEPSTGRPAQHAASLDDSISDYEAFHRID